MHIGTFTPRRHVARRHRAARGARATSASRCSRSCRSTNFPAASAGATTASICSRRRGSTARPTISARFVDAAHAHGLGVILDVVYNHFGPDGCYLTQFAPKLLHRRVHERLGRADQLRWRRCRAGARVLRRRTPRIGSTSFISTACGSTPRRASTTTRRSTSSARSSARAREAARGSAIVHRRRKRAAGRAVRADRGGYGLDALWNDDFHHSAMVAADRDARSLLHRLSRQRRRSSSPLAKWGFLYQGQWYSWQKNAAARRRSTCRRRRSSASSRITIRSRTRRAASVCSQLTSPGRCRALTALLLLAPGTPMLFQGQEFAASSAVSLLRRSQAGARAARARRAHSAARAVSQERPTPQID